MYGAGTDGGGHASCRAQSKSLSQWILNEKSTDESKGSNPAGTSSTTGDVTSRSV